MCKTRKQIPFTVTFLALIAAAVILETTAPVFGAVITPRIGGADRRHDVAPMIMPVITFDGMNIAVQKEAGGLWETLAWENAPVMWPLQGDDTLAPGVWYNALNGMAWNWQYGWENPGNNAPLPTGGKFWIEVRSQSEGLNTYERSTTAYTAIFGTIGTDGTPTSLRWMWPETMAHNAYTVTPQYGQWEAIYRVYIGYENNDVNGAYLRGDPMPGFGYQDVTLRWTSVPEPATLALLLTGLVCACRQKRSY